MVFTVSAVVSNTGTASGSVGKVAVWTSGYAGAMACGNTTGADKVVDLSSTSVAAGRTSTITVPGLINTSPGAPATLGVFLSSACATGGSAAQMQRALAYTPTAPEFGVRAITLPTAAVKPGATFTATATIANTGTAGGVVGTVLALPDASLAGAGPWGCPGTGAATGWVASSLSATTTIAAGATAQAPFTITAPTAPGTYRLALRIDALVGGMYCVCPVLQQWGVGARLAVLFPLRHSYPSNFLTPPNQSRSASPLRNNSAKQCK